MLLNITPVLSRCLEHFHQRRFVLKHLCFDGLQDQKKLLETPGNALSDALLLSLFQIVVAGAAKYNRALRGFYY